MKNITAIVICIVVLVLCICVPVICYCVTKEKYARTVVPYPGCKRQKRLRNALTDRITAYPKLPLQSCKKTTYNFCKNMQPRNCCSNSGLGCCDGENLYYPCDYGHPKLGILTQCGDKKVMTAPGKIG